MTLALGGASIDSAPVIPRRLRRRDRARVPTVGPRPDGADRRGARGSRRGRGRHPVRGRRHRERPGRLVRGRGRHVERPHVVGATARGVRRPAGDAPGPAARPLRQGGPSPGQEEGQEGQPAEGRPGPGRRDPLGPRGDVPREQLQRARRLAHRPQRQQARLPLRSGAHGRSAGPDPRLRCRRRRLPGVRVGPVRRLQPHDRWLVGRLPGAPARPQLRPQLDRLEARRLHGREHPVDLHPLLPRQPRAHAVRPARAQRERPQGVVHQRPQPGEHQEPPGQRALARRRDRPRDRARQPAARADRLPRDPHRRLQRALRGLLQGHRALPGARGERRQRGGRLRTRRPPTASTGSSAPRTSRSAATGSGAPASATTRSSAAPRPSPTDAPRGPPQIGSV